MVARPVHGVHVADHADDLVRLRFAVVEAAAVLVGQLVRRIGRDHAFLHQLPGIEHPRGRPGSDHRVHHRLRGRRLVGLVVAEAPVADEVDHHVLVELLAVFDREARGEHHRLRVVAVHVQDRRLDHLRDVAAVERGARVARVVRGESDLVVDDHVHGAAGIEGARLRQLQRLLDHALAGESRVAVDQHGHHLVTRGVPAALLAGAHRALDHRVHHLEVRGVERERHVHVAARGAHVAREALVVLHVAGALELLQVVVALELREQLRRGLAEHVDQHVQAAAVRHADDDVLEPVRAAGLDEVLEQRDQAVAALEREALLRRVARGEVALEPLGHGEVPEDVLLLLGREVLLRAPDLEAVLQPETLGLVRDVRELGADRAAVDVLQLLDDLAQLEARLDRAVAAAGEEFGVEVGLGEAEVVEAHHLGHRPLQQA